MQGGVEPRRNAPTNMTEGRSRISRTGDPSIGRLLGVQKSRSEQTGTETSEG